MAILRLTGMTIAEWAKGEPIALRGPQQAAWHGEWAVFSWQTR
jgi:hypothetical protein